MLNPKQEIVRTILLQGSVRGTMHHEHSSELTQKACRAITARPEVRTISKLQIQQFKTSFLISFIWYKIVSDFNSYLDFEFVKKTGDSIFCSVPCNFLIAVIRCWLLQKHVVFYQGLPFIRKSLYGTD